MSSNITNDGCESVDDTSYKPSENSLENNYNKICSKTNNDYLDITLYKFRCWDHLNLKIPLGISILIKGESGLGKSTIFKSILWCLYKKGTNVTPFNSKNAKTKVILKIDNLVIERQKNPNKITVYEDGFKFEEDAANHIIEKHFGTLNCWLCSSYIDQKKRNYFFNMDNNSKFDFLNQLSFCNTKSNITLRQKDILLESIIENIKKVENEYKISNQNYEDFNKFYQKKYPGIEKLTFDKYFEENFDKEFSENFNKEFGENFCQNNSENIICDKDKYFIYKNNILTDIILQKQNYKKILEEKLTIKNFNNTRIKDLENMLNDLKKEKLKQPKISEKLLEFKKKLLNLLSNDLFLKEVNQIYIEKNHNLENNFEDEIFKEEVFKDVMNYLSSVLQLLKHKENLKKKLEKLEKNQLNDFNIEITTEKLNEYKNKFLDYSKIENLYSVNELKAKKLCVEYNKDKINFEREILEDIISSQEHLNKIEKLKIIKSNISEFENSKEELIRELENENPETIDDEEYINTLNDIKEYINILLKRIPELKSELETNIQKKSDLTSELKILNTDLNKLKKNKVIPLSCPQCKNKLQMENNKLITFKGLEEDIEILENKIKTKENNLKSLEKKTKTLKNKIIEKEDYLEDYKNQEIQLQKNKQDSINEYKKKLEKLYNEEKIRTIRLESLQKEQIQLECELNTKNFINKKIYNSKEILNFKKKLDELKNIQFYEKINKTDRVQKKIKFLEISLEIENIKTEINNINLKEYVNHFTYDYLKIILQEYEQYKKELHLYHKDKQIYENKYQNICNEMNKIEIDNFDYEKEIEIIKNDIYKIEENRKYLELIKDAYEQYKNLQEKKKIIDDFMQELYYLKYIKKEFKITERESLNSTLLNLNSLLNNICSLIFDLDISIKLETQKQLKSKKEKKDLVYLNIFYKDGIFDDVENLSGGEGDKVSFALTLTFNKFKKTPFILLDESLGSLDIKNKINIMESIKELNKEKNNFKISIIVVSPNENEECYDKVIDLEKILNSENNLQNNLRNELQSELQNELQDNLKSCKSKNTLNDNQKINTDEKNTTDLKKKLTKTDYKKPIVKKKLTKTELTSNEKNLKNAENNEKNTKKNFINDVENKQISTIKKRGRPPKK